MPGELADAQLRSAYAMHEQLARQFYTETVVPTKKRKPEVTPQNKAMTPPENKAVSSQRSAVSRKRRKSK